MTDRRLRLAAPLLLAAGLLIGGAAQAAPKTPGNGVLFPLEFEASEPVAVRPLAEPEDSILLTQARPRSAVVLTGNGVIADGKGRQIASVAPGLVMIEAQMLGATVYCGLAPRPERNKYVGDYAVCGRDADGDGAFESLLIDMNRNGAWTALDITDISLAAPGAAVPYRRLEAAERPVFDVEVGYLHENPRYRFRLVLGTPDVLRTTAVHWSKRIVISVGSANRWDGEIHNPGKERIHALGPYQIKVTGERAALSAEVLSATPARTVMLSPSGFMFYPNAAPSRTLVLSQTTEVQP